MGFLFIVNVTVKVFWLFSENVSIVIGWIAMNFPHRMKCEYFPYCDGAPLTFPLAPSLNQNLFVYDQIPVGFGTCVAVHLHCGNMDCIGLSKKL